MRLLRWFVGAIAAVALTWILLFAWRELRGIGPAVAPPSGDIVKSIENATPTTGTNETGLPLKLPPGYSISIFAKGLGDPRDIIDLFNGVYLVSAPSSGKIYALEDGGKARVTVAISGLRKPHGMAVKYVIPGETWVYIAEENQVGEYLFDDSTHKLTFIKKLFDLPTGGNHTTRSLLLLPDGRLLVSIGSTCNVCHESNAERATIQVWDGKTLKPFAVGLRNSVFMTMADDGAVWATEMGRDLLGDNVPPDEVNVIEEGKNYGWPNCYGQNIHDDQFDKNVYIRNPCMAPFETPSRVDIPAHSAPLGLSFFNGDLLVAYHGSWNRSVPTGYKIARIKLDAQGNEVGIEDFITGWLTKDGNALGRPVDIERGRGGDLYISDDKAGVIYRVTPSGLTETQK
jgi:glucose/arabinose dehydrogenase